MINFKCKGELVSSLKENNLENFYIPRVGEKIIFDSEKDYIFRVIDVERFFNTIESSCAITIHVDKFAK